VKLQGRVVWTINELKRGQGNAEIEKKYRILLKDPVTPSWTMEPPILEIHNRNPAAIEMFKAKERG